MYAAVRRLRQRLLHGGKHKTRYPGSVGPSRLSLLARLRAVVRTAGRGREAADTLSTADSQEPLNDHLTLSNPFDPVQCSGVIVRPGRSRLGSSPSPLSPQPVSNGTDSTAVDAGEDTTPAENGISISTSMTPPSHGFRINGNSSLRNRRLYQQQLRKAASSAHLPPFHARMRMDKYISRALTLLARVSSKSPQDPGTIGEPCQQLRQAAGLAFTFSRKVGVGILGGQRATGFVIQKLERQAVGGDRDAAVHFSAPLFFKSRSCEAGLQAGAAKCQTLTLFTSHDAVENFIQSHAEFEASAGSIAVPLLKGPKSRSASVSLPGRLHRSRPTMSQCYTVTSGAFCNFLPISGGAVKLDGAMMEGVYGRRVSGIEVLRGWEPAPPQFKPLYSALQTWPGPSRSISAGRLGRRSCAPLPTNADAQATSGAEDYSSSYSSAASGKFTGFVAGNSPSSSTFDRQAEEQLAEEQLAADHAAADRTASQSPPPKQVSFSYRS